MRLDPREEEACRGSCLVFIDVLGRDVISFSSVCCVSEEASVGRGGRMGALLGPGKSSLMLALLLLLLNRVSDLDLRRRSE